MAHDLNNLLTPVIGYAELLQVQTEEHVRFKPYLAEIINAAMRARDLVGQLLAFGRKQTLEYQPMDLNQTLAGFERLLRRTIREDIGIVIKSSPQIPVIMADTRQIEQVILNLAVNASDAMPQGGSLSIETSLSELDQEYAEHHAGVRPGTYVMLSVSDTGHGMDEATISQNL